MGSISTRKINECSQCYNVHNAYNVPMPTMLNATQLQSGLRESFFILHKDKFFCGQTCVEAKSECGYAWGSYYLHLKFIYRGNKC